MGYETLIDAFNDLRERCYKAIRTDPELLGDDMWLRYAINETDINLAYWPEGIHCWGHCYSMRSADTEHFSFTIPFDILEAL